MKYPLPRLFLLAAAVAVGAVAAEPASLAGTRPTSVDFEAVPEGPLSGVPGWAVESGRAVVTAVDFGRALRLQASSPECAVVAQSPTCQSLTVAFTVRGVRAAERAEAMELVNVGGALLALVADSPGRARFWVLDGGAAKPEWKPTGVTAAVDSSGVLLAATRVTVSIDTASGRWSFGVAGKSSGAAFSLLKDEALGAAHRFYGFAEGDWFLDDYRVAEGLDTDAAVTLGVPPVTRQSDEAAALLRRAKSGLSGRTGLPLGAAAAAAAAQNAELPTVYVDAIRGNDANDGSKAQPKASLTSACEALGRDFGRVVVAQGEYRPVLRRFQKIVFVYNGEVIIR